MRVAAAGVNRADLLQAAGHYPPPRGESEILGLECAGTIADAGRTGRTVGEPVACLLAGGAYAEYVAVPEGQLAPWPAGFSAEAAGSVTEVACTVWFNLSMVAGIRAGQRVLVHGGGGGIGSFAIQLAKALGAEVATTVGSSQKAEYCRDLGADIVVNYREQDFAEVLRGSCDVILDIIGAKYLDQNLRCLAADGQLVIIGLQGGTKAQINLGRLLPKRLSLHGRTLRAQSAEKKAKVVESTVENAWPLLSSGAIRHHVHASYPLAEAAAAHEALRSGAVTGKLVLTLD